MGVGPAVEARLTGKDAENSLNAADIARKLGKGDSPSPAQKSDLCLCLHLCLRQRLLGLRGRQLASLLELLGSHSCATWPLAACPARANLHALIGTETKAELRGGQANTVELRIRVHVSSRAAEAKAQNQAPPRAASERREAQHRLLVREGRRLLLFLRGCFRCPRRGKTLSLTLTLTLPLPLPLPFAGTGPR